MNAIRAIVRAGRVDIAVPPEWLDGTEVDIQPHQTVDDEEPLTPEEIQRIFAAMARVEPLDISEEDEPTLSAWEKKVNDYSIANNDKGIEDVFR